jgi:hypothetical protein
MEEPTIVYLFNKDHWANVIHPVTKLELMDMIPKSGFNFFYDVPNNSYVLVLRKSFWEGLENDIKIHFVRITRRIKEEVEGLFTDAQREAIESSDPFDIFAQRDAGSTNAQQIDRPATIPEGDEGTAEATDNVSDGEETIDISSITSE